MNRYQISVVKEKNKYIFLWWLVCYSQIALCGTKFNTYCGKIKLDLWNRFKQEIAILHFFGTPCIFFWILVSYSQIALCGTKFDTYCAKLNFTHLHSIKTSKTEVKGKTWHNWQKLTKVGKSWQKLQKTAKVGYSCQKLSKVAT